MEEPKAQFIYTRPYYDVSGGRWWINYAYVGRQGGSIESGVAGGKDVNECFANINQKFNEYWKIILQDSVCDKCENVIPNSRLIAINGKQYCEACCEKGGL